MKKIGLFTSMDFDVSTELDGILRKILSSYKLESVTYMSEYIHLNFEKGVEVMGWNSRYSCYWFGHGKIFIDGKLFYKWEYTRPRKITMNKIIRKLENFSVKILEDNFNNKIEEKITDFFDTDLEL